MPPSHRKISSTIRIGTRGSPLALWQAREVARLIQRHDPNIKIKEVLIKTSGDKFQKAPLKNYSGKRHQYSGKGLFVKEIEEALTHGRIDIAVHSLKDIPANIPNGLQLTAYLKRADCHDLFVSAKYNGLNNMPRASLFGTSSPRRAAQVLSVRPDLKIVPLRGNVETRLAKMNSGICDATILATAGLKRLKLFSRLKHLHTQTLKQFVPAIGQGIIAIESRTKDSKLNAFLRSSLNDRITEAAAIAERSFLNAVGGDCHTPIAGHAIRKGRNIRLAGFVASPNGREGIKKTMVGTDPIDVGNKLGSIFVGLGARIIMDGEQKKQKVVLITKLDSENTYFKMKMIHLPLIEILSPSDNYKSIDMAIKNGSKYEWIAFTSKNAAEHFLKRPGAARFLQSVKIAAVGPATAKKLTESGFRVNLVPQSDFGAKSLADKFLKIDLRGKWVLFPRAKEGLDMLAIELKKQGAKVDIVEAYRTRPAKIDAKRWSAYFRKNPIKLITFSSPSAVKAYIKNFGGLPKTAKIICQGETTKRALISLRQV